MTCIAFGLVGDMRPIQEVIHSEDRRSHPTEEVAVMSDEDNANGGKVKTLAIRLEPDVHAQLSLIAQLRGPKGTITDEIHTAIEAHITATKAAPELAGKADAVLEEIEREAASRREAIATLFGSQDESPAPSTGTSRSRKSGSKEAPPEG